MTVIDSKERYRERERARTSFIPYDLPLIHMARSGHRALYTAQIECNSFAKIVQGIYRMLTRDLAHS